MQILAIIGACALCALCGLVGFVGGCIACYYDYVEITRYRAGQCAEDDARRCEYNARNYGRAS
jgi:succinate-acetate transporter protein